MSAPITSRGSEILIYSTHFSFNEKHKGPPIECLVEHIPANTQWIFVLKSELVTMYVEAYNNNGKLDTRIFYDEPQDVITKTSIGFVNATANDIHKLVYESKQRGMTYSLDDGEANCQTFIKEILKKLDVGPDLKTISDIEFLSKWETAKMWLNIFSSK
ncbi:UNVERIFIED_CONTAM: hypothetical protein RMT77_013048 [Armadillidium vulgare]